ncbi:hypothetical protein JZ751_013492 [Albula glossodonta]|uniref:Sushi domain-containing protein n=1 Tax=Albula glossodonta TaxID=121402 RepID=A0A8T2MVM6_9TELE|nr:hypothetical protein JZ751_013492 [Albula glossodonta]
MTVNHAVKGDTACLEAVWGAHGWQKQAVHCPSLRAPQDGNMTCSAESPAEFPYGSTCTFTCADGFQLQGVSSVTCTESAEWSQDTPYCEAITCKSLEAGDHLVTNCSHSSDNLKLNSSCSFSCDEGFILQGAESLQCTGTGKWSADTPTSITCESPEQGDHLVRKCSHSSSALMPNSNCSFSCDEGFDLQGSETLTCNSSGNWTGEVPSCQAQSRLDPTFLGMAAGGACKGSQPGVPAPPGGARWNFRGCDKEWLVSLSDESRAIIQPVASVP